MNRFMAFSTSVVLLCGGASWAQNKTVGTGQAGTPMPVVHVPIAGFGKSANANASSIGSNMRSVNAQVRAQMRQIQKDLKTGKITKEQAKAAWENLKAIRQQEKEFFHQNGQKEITADQKNQLNQILQSNESSL